MAVFPGLSLGLKLRAKDLFGQAVLSTATDTVCLDAICSQWKAIRLREIGALDRFCQRLALDLHKLYRGKYRSQLCENP